MTIKILDRRLRRAATGLLASLLFLLPTTASAREIIFPPDASLVREESLSILGYRLKSAGTLSVSTGGKEKKSKVGPGYFSVTVTLAHGFTTVSLADETVKIFYPEGGVPKEASSFLKPDLHAVDNGCDDCHTEEGTRCVRSISRSFMVEQGREACAQEQECLQYCFQVKLSNSP